MALTRLALAVIASLYQAEFLFISSAFQSICGKYRHTCGALLITKYRKQIFYSRNALENWIYIACAYFVRFSVRLVWKYTALAGCDDGHGHLSAILFHDIVGINGDLAAINRELERCQKQTSATSFRGNSSMQKIKQHPIGSILLFYLISFLFRAIEYMVLRTDQSIIGEAFIHKLIGILLLLIAMKSIHYKWEDVGLIGSKARSGIPLGLLLGGAAFTVAYGAELLMQVSAGNVPSLQFNVTSYAIQANRGMQDGAVFILICIVGNIINVMMEEGVFRGLFIRLAEEKHSFTKACIFSSILFGIWHIAQPVRNAVDGTQSIVGALFSALLLVVASTLVGIQFSLLLKITGSLWTGMAAHFANNAIINLIHVVTLNGIDELQTVRITIAQTISFIVVLLIFLLQNKRRKSRDFLTDQLL